MQMLSTVLAFRLAGKRRKEGGKEGGSEDGNKCRLPVFYIWRWHKGNK